MVNHDPMVALPETNIVENDNNPLAAAGLDLFAVTLGFVLFTRYRKK
ncbi:LPXTG cell wall anchor domain-containing protein [Weissella oryzae]|nr:LPXTG cell wall anchor domain-containing protein [Weissella oryzae]